MASKRYDIKIAVGSPDGPRSSVWHFWSKKNDVYVAHSNMGGVQKFSFHPPNICRHAFTREHGAPPKMGKREMHAWLRDPTPPAGLDQTVRVLRVAFGTDVLSTALDKAEQKGPLVWIEAAPAGGTTVLDLMFICDDEATVRAAVERSVPEMRHRLVAYKQLLGSEAFCITSHHVSNRESPFRSTAPHEDIIVSPVDIIDSGRPIRLTMFSNPKDGDFFQAWEMGAYAIAPPLTDESWEALTEAMLASPPDFNRIATVMASPRASFADPGALLREGAIAFHRSGRA